MTNFPEWYSKSGDAVLQKDIATLKFLLINIGQHYSLQHILSDVQKAIYNGQVGLDGGRGMSVSFSWEIEIAGRSGFKIYIGAIIGRKENEITDSSYSFIITKEKKSGKERVFRKFHFDFNNPNNLRKNSQPFFHLQYGGKLPSFLSEKLCDKHINNWLSEPRIIHHPMSLALVLDSVFSEFPSESTNKLRRETNWSTIIKANQEFLWKPYYNHCKLELDRSENLMDGLCSE